MNIYVVATYRIDNSGIVRIYHHDNDRVIALTWEDAERQLQAKGLAKTHEVIGELVAEIPCVTGTLLPDWNKGIDYELIKTN